ncbi:MAG TPA: hypothetical protein VGG16_28620 [Streptosporangiaceae bacterium]
MKALITAGVITGAVLCGLATAAPAANASAPVRFATPLAAARYFAAAVNHDDLAALHQVTTPTAFKEVMGMRKEAKYVRALSCTATGRGDDSCFLSIGHGQKQWSVIVAPAIDPGWYVYGYGYLGCGG